jgi:uncharacterized membrane protein
MNNWQAWQIHLNRLRVINSQPSWVVRLTLACAAAVIIIPLVLLALAAIIVGVMVFITLTLVALVIQSIRSLLNPSPSFGSNNESADDGRRNVRVIIRE